MFYFQAPCICDAPASSECCNSSERHLQVEHDEQKLDHACQNLFSSLQATFVDGSVPSDTKCLLVPKSEHKRTTESAGNVDSCDQEKTDIDFRSSDYVQSIIVKLPLIARLRHIKCETPVPCIKTEISDADKDRCGVDEEKVDPPAAADVHMTDDIQNYIKKEATAAAKGRQLARETIANILGTELQPPTMMKIPIKRRADRDADERSDTKRSRTFSRNDDVRDRSSDRQLSRYVLELTAFWCCYGTMQYSYC